MTIVFFSVEYTSWADQRKTWRVGRLCTSCLKKLFSYCLKNKYVMYRKQTSLEISSVMLLCFYQVKCG